jgi:hypothetical protein
MIIFSSDDSYTTKFTRITRNRISESSGETPTTEPLSENISTEQTHNNIDFNYIYGIMRIEIIHTKYLLFIFVMKITDLIFIDLNMREPHWNIIGLLASLSF